MEVILLWEKTKTKFGLSIFPHIITEKWGLMTLVLFYPFQTRPQAYFHYQCTTFLHIVKLIMSFYGFSHRVPFFDRSSIQG